MILTKLRPHCDFNENIRECIIPFKHVACKLFFVISKVLGSFTYKFKKYNLVCPSYKDSFIKGESARLASRRKLPHFTERRRV